MHVKITLRRSLQSVTCRFLAATSVYVLLSTPLMAQNFEQLCKEVCHLSVSNPVAAMAMLTSGRETLLAGEPSSGFNEAAQVKLSTIESILRTKIALAALKKNDPQSAGSTSLLGLGRAPAAPLAFRFSAVTPAPIVKAELTPAPTSSTAAPTVHATASPSVAPIDEPSAAPKAAVVIPEPMVAAPVTASLAPPVDDLAPSTAGPAVGSFAAFTAELASVNDKATLMSRLSTTQKSFSAERGSIAKYRLGKQIIAIARKLRAIPMLAVEDRTTILLAISSTELSPPHWNALDTAPVGRHIVSGYNTRDDGTSEALEAKALNEDVVALQDIADLGIKETHHIPEKIIAGLQVRNIQTNVMLISDGTHGHYVVGVFDKDNRTVTVVDSMKKPQSSPIIGVIAAKIGELMGTGSWTVKSGPTGIGTHLQHDGASCGFWAPIYARQIAHEGDIAAAQKVNRFMLDVARHIETLGSSAEIQGYLEDIFINNPQLLEERIANVREPLARMPDDWGLQDYALIIETLRKKDGMPHLLH